MTFRQLRAFLAVFEEESFSKASLRAHATQSGLSMLIRNLEEELGVRLFERSSLGVSPTTAGVRYYERCIAIMTAVEEANREARDLSGNVSGRVVAGLMPNHTRGALAPALAEFIERYPSVQIHIVEAYSGLLTENVARGLLDFAIVPEHHHRDAIHSRLLGADREILVSGAGQRWPHMHSVRLADLGPLKVILPGPQNARRAHIEAYCERENVKIDRILELDAMIGTFELVARGDWVTILPTTILINELRQRGNFTLNPIVEPTKMTTYALIEPASRPPSLATRLFCKTLEAEMQNIAAEWEAALGTMAQTRAAKRPGAGYHEQATSASIRNATQVPVRPHEYAQRQKVCMPSTSTQTEPFAISRLHKVEETPAPLRPLRLDRGYPKK